MDIDGCHMAGLCHMAGGSWQLGRHLGSWAESAGPGNRAGRRGCTVSWALLDPGHEGVHCTVSWAGEQGRPSAGQGNRAGLGNGLGNRAGLGNGLGPAGLGSPPGPDSPESHGYTHSVAVGVALSDFLLRPYFPSRSRSRRPLPSPALRRRSRRSRSRRSPGRSRRRQGSLGRRRSPSPPRRTQSPARSRWW